MGARLDDEIIDNALCTGDSETFFPDFPPKSAEQRKAVAKAKAICLDCPVALKCLEFAIENGEQGIWGGTTTEERKSFRRSYAMKRKFVFDLKQRAMFKP